MRRGPAGVEIEARAAAGEFDGAAGRQGLGNGKAADAKRLATVANPP